MKWTDERERVLFENAPLGADAVLQAIREETGGNPTIAAVVKHASRMGISLMKFYVCPQCGCRHTERHSDGLCTLCHHRRLRDAYNSRQTADSPNAEDIARARREYDLARKRNSRSVVSMKLSSGMSTRRSNAKKVLERRQNEEETN